MNLEEIEEKARYAFMNAKDVTLSKDEFNSLIAEVKRLRAEIERLQKLAGDFLGTDPEMQNTACIEVAITHAKWLSKENYRLRKQLELEHDQGESFLTQIKELQAENERLKKHSPDLNRG